MRIVRDAARARGPSRITRAAWCVVRDAPRAMRGYHDAGLSAMMRGYHERGYRERGYRHEPELAMMRGYHDRGYHVRGYHERGYRHEPEFAMMRGYRP